jgi:hypothetical protein
MIWFKDIQLFGIQFLVSKNFSEQEYGVMIEFYYNNEYYYALVSVEKFDVEKLEEKFEAINKSHCESIYYQVIGSMN